MTGHIFDIDVLLNINAKPWIIDKNNPTVPLLKISKSDFNLIKNGVYKKQNNLLEYNGNTYWLPNDLFNKLKIISKNKKINIGDIAISMREFLNKDEIENVEYTVNLEVINHLFGKKEDIYLICSTNTERNYNKLAESLVDILKKNNLKINKIYYLKDSFFNSDVETTVFRKALICLKHLVGYEIQNEKFVDAQIDKYSKIEYYDDDFDTLKMVDEINSFLNFIVSKTDSGLREIVKEDVNDDKPVFIANKLTNNKYNKFVKKECKVSFNTIKKFN